MMASFGFDTLYGKRKKCLSFAIWDMAQITEILPANKDPYTLHNQDRT